MVKQEIRCIEYFRAEYMTTDVYDVPVVTMLIRDHCGYKVLEMVGYCIKIEQQPLFMDGMEELVWLCEQFKKEVDNK